MTRETATHFVIEIALEAKTVADQQKLDAALQKLAAEDSSFQVSTDFESGLAILSGASELELDRALGRLIESEGVGLNCGAPQVAYRETLGQRAHVAFTYETPAGRSGRFARVELAFEPAERGSGFRFESQIAEDSLPQRYVAAIQRALESARAQGLLAGFPVIDFRATLTGAAFHELDSSELAFELATRQAFRELRKQGAPKLLEPWMEVAISTPKDHSRAVLGDLTRRRGEILDTEHIDGEARITALAPLANMFGYGSWLQDVTGGGGRFTMLFDHYSELELGDPPPDNFPEVAAMRA